MLDRWLHQNTHYSLHLIGLLGIAVGLPLSKAVLSISTLALLLNLFLKADFKSYFENWKNNRVFLLLLVFFMLHFVGLIWSENIDYGLNDIWKKIPLLIVPAVGTAIPLKTSNDRRFVLLTFVVCVMLTSIVNVLTYHQVIGNQSIIEFRNMSQVGSHVRYALLVVLAIVVMYHEIINKRILTAAFITIGWLIFYTFYSQVLAGFIALIVAFFVILFYHFYSKRKVILILFSSLSIILSICFTTWLFYRPQIDKQVYRSKLENKSSEGNLYVHDLNLISPETSNPIGEYICWKELSREWAEISDLPFKGLDKKGQLLSQTLIRYMASMNLRKDAEGFSNLSNRDIANIENGCASHFCNGIIARIYGLRYEILNESNPNGHSMLQRIEYWKAGLSILQKNFFLGIGTGDVQATFNDYYTSEDSQLLEKNRLRTHNYYITVGLTFGLFGLVIFLWLHVEYFKTVQKSMNLIGLCFLWILLISYISEDTLETQVGVTLFSFFITLFIRPIQE